MNRSRKNFIAGFTLIEVIVSVAIFAIIAAITFPALIQFLDIREKINIKNESLSDIQKVFLFFNRDVTYAVNRLGKDEFGELADAPLKVGDDALIELTTSYQDYELDGSGMPRKVKWIFEDGELIRVQYPVLDPDGDTRVYRQKLLKNLKDVEVVTFSIDEGRESESSRWDEESRLPNMLKMTIEFENGIYYERYATMLSGDKDKVELQSANQPTVGPGAGEISTDESSSESGRR